MKGIITIILCFLLFLGIVLAILFHEYVRKLKKMLKQAADAREARKMAKEDEYFKRTSNKYYREDDTPKFKDGYFNGKNEQEKYDRARYEKENTTNRQKVETNGGVTIVDDLDGDQRASRKIFDDSEGEYVEFEEV